MHLWRRVKRVLWRPGEERSRAHSRHRKYAGLRGKRWSALLKFFWMSTAAMMLVLLSVHEDYWGINGASRNEKGSSSRRSYGESHVKKWSWSKSEEFLDDSIKKELGEDILRQLESRRMKMKTSMITDGGNEAGFPPNEDDASVHPHSREDTSQLDQQQTPSQPALETTNSSGGSLTHGQSNRPEDGLQESDAQTSDYSSASEGKSASFWAWFQFAKEIGDFKCAVGPNNRLCQMFYKFVKKYKSRHVFDVNCAGNAPWIGEVLSRLSNELWGFQYTCAISDDLEEDKIRALIGDLHCVNLTKIAWWNESLPKGIEFLFAWDTLPHISFGRAYKLFRQAKASNAEIILFDNYPDIVNSPEGKREYINVRKHPFRFPSAREVVQDVVEDGERMRRQLLLYRVEDLPIKQS